jgi:hypothetical protein
VKNRGFVVVLLIIAAVNSLSLQHIFKVPVLVVHYFEHQQRGPDITVIEFLSMHYWGQDINDNDHERDMQLPFKKFDISQSVTALFFQPSSQFNFSDFPLHAEYTITNSEDHISQHLGSLFKPPRLS